MQLAGQSNKFFLQVKAAGRGFDFKASCGGCDSFFIPQKKRREPLGFIVVFVWLSIH
jgi:hypothetical protein